MNRTQLTHNSGTRLIALLAAVFSTMPAHGVDYTNAASLVLPAFHAGPGAASLYPSAIDVSGLPGAVGKVAVTLHGISIDRPDDLEVMLVGPDGSHLIILGDAGGISTVSGITLRLDDTASAAVPDAGSFTAGTFRPTSVNSSTTSFPAPAPSPAYLQAAPGGSATFASVFNGLNPNGTWSLYVVDDVSSGSSGAIAGGWSLELLTSPPLNYISASATNGHPFIRFTGISGQSYYFQWASVVTGPYQDFLPALTAGSEGVLEYEDTTVPTTLNRYYRVRTAP